MTSRAVKTTTILAAVGLLFVAATSAAQSPNEMVEATAKLIDEQLNGRKDELSNDRNALYELIDEILIPRFDRKYAAQIVLGKHWRPATGEQREAFIDAFYKSLRRKYADGLLEFNLDRIEILPFRGDASKKRTSVKTVVTLNDGTEVPVNYGLVRREQGWLMFDVVIEGISYVRNFRAELNSEIRNSSLDAVIERLQGESAESQTVAEETATESDDG